MSFDLKLENGDLKIGSNADLGIVEFSEKLTQDVLKILTTQLGSNQRYPWYGCPISQSLVGRAFDQVFIQSVATNQLRFSITNLQRLQQEQMRTDQIVTPQEQIAAIQDVNVERNTIDPRFFNIAVILLSKAFRRVQASFNVNI